MQLSTAKYIEAKGSAALAERTRKYNKRNYDRHGDKYREDLRVKRAVLRAEFIREYGGVCACCGESEPAFLTLEHLERDGKAHRDDVGHYPDHLLKDLQRRGWPKDKYALMCFNCNRARWVLGECPHQRKKCDF